MRLFKKVVLYAAIDVPDDIEYEDMMEADSKLESDIAADLQDMQKENNYCYKFSIYETEEEVGTYDLKALNEEMTISKNIEAKTNEED